MTTELTDLDISQTFSLLKTHSEPCVYPVLEKLEAIVRIERDQRMLRRASLADLNDILAADLNEPPTCAEELERAGVSFTAGCDFDLFRDMERGK